MDKLKFEFGEMNQMYKTEDSFIHQVHETDDSFIFQTLCDFASVNYQITVKKEELIYAIQLIKMYKAYGVDISQRLDTATQQGEWYRHAYNRGLEDGIKQEHDRVMAVLNNTKDKIQKMQSSTEKVESDIVNKE